MASDRDFRKLDAKDHIRSETQKAMRQYIRRIVKESIDEFEREVDEPNADGTLRDPVVVAQEIQARAYTKVLGGDERGALPA